MPRSRIAVTYALWTLALAALFAVFIAFQENAALLSALSAAGTVAAGVFAAVAAMGSMRAAAESSATARRASETLARTAQPRLRPSFGRADGKLIGRVTCDPGRTAIDVSIVWIPTQGDAKTEQLARLEPQRPDLPAGAPVASALDLGLPDAADVTTEIRMVWIEYWDDGRLGHWQDTWEVGTVAPEKGRLRLTDSRLAD